MRSLEGLRMVVTRAPHQSADLANLLAAQGAEVIFLPTIDIVPPEDSSALEAAARNPSSFECVIFTSANAVRAFRRFVPDPQVKQWITAVVGTSTGEEAEACGFSVEVVAEKFVAESLVDALRLRDPRGKRFLLPAAAVTREVIPDELRKLGAEVVVIEAYRNVRPSETERLAPIIFSLPLPNWALFASPSAFENLLPLVSPKLLAQVSLASIGPVTTAAIHRHGFEVSAEPEVHTIPALVESIVAAVERRRASTA